jgi:hypothetical protein
LSGQQVRTVYVADRRTTATGLLGGLLGLQGLGGDANNMFAVRLINGQWLPNNGLTVATVNPMYIKGHYNVTTNGTPANLGTSNTSKTRPASVAADSLTILSVDWNDSDGGVALSSSNREAEDTTVNTAILVGNTDTVSGYFGGGVHNLPRYLEDWAVHTFTLNTSIVCMFASHIATGAFVSPGSSGEYYKAPDRNWSFDANFNDPNKLPPATPQIRVLLRGAWND